MAGIRGGPDGTEAGNSSGPSQADAGPYLSPWALCGCCGVIPALTPPLGSPAWLWQSHRAMCVGGGGHDPRTSHSPKSRTTKAPGSCWCLGAFCTVPEQD